MSHAAKPYPDDATPSTPAAPSLDAPASAAQVIAMSELEPTNGAQRSAGPLANPQDLHNPLRHVKAKLTVCAGSAEVTIGDLLGAREQQVLRLDRTIEQPVDVLLEGHVVARGVLVAVDEHFAVRITEVPVSLDAPLGTPRKP